jgi:dihydrolipoamide dehydrogenase
MDKEFDLVVIGSGAAGTVAAHSIALSGKKVCIVEMEKLGGDAIHSSIIPSKSLLEAANALSTARSLHKLGIRTSGVSYNYRSIQAAKDKAINMTGVNNEIKSFKSEGIITKKGRAHFVSEDTISVGLTHIKSKRFLITTGAVPFIPTINGLNETGYITYKEAVNLTRPPKSLFIIGGGSTAYEFGQIFSSFGTKVHIAELKDHLLPKEDPEIGDSAEAALSDKGVRVHTLSKIIEVNGSYGRKIVSFEQNGQQHRVNVEEIMVACGKTPQTDLGLDNACVRYSPSGIVVNKHLRTSNKSIYCAGEATGSVYSIHASIQQARIAAHNLFGRKKISMDYRSIPRVVFGIPEIAAVGITEHQLLKTDIPFQSAIAPIGIVSKSKTTNYAAGFVKLLASHTGIILGASIVAPSASEMIGELALATHSRLHACSIAQTVHPAPSWSEAIRVAASKIHCI